MRKTFLILATILALAVSHAQDVVANVSLLQWREDGLLMRADFVDNIAREQHTRLYKVSLKDGKAELIFPTEEQIKHLDSLGGKGFAKYRLCECVPVPNTDLVFLLYSTLEADDEPSSDAVPKRRLFLMGSSGSISEIRVTETSRYLQTLKQANLQIDGIITPDIFEVSLQGNDLILTLLTRFDDGVGTVSFIVSPDLNPVALAPAGGTLRHPKNNNIMLSLHSLDEDSQNGLYEVRLDAAKQARVVQSIAPYEVHTARYAPNGNLVGYVRSSKSVSTIEVWFRETRTTKRLPLPWEVRSESILYQGYYTENFLFSPDSSVIAIPVRAFFKESRYEWHIWFWNVHTEQVKVLRLPFHEQSEDE